MPHRLNRKRPLDSVSETYDTSRPRTSARTRGMHSARLSECSKNSLAHLKHMSGVDLFEPSRHTAETTSRRYAALCCVEGLKLTDPLHAPTLIDTIEQDPGLKLSPRDFCHLLGAFFWGDLPPPIEVSRFVSRALSPDERFEKEQLIDAFKTIGAIGINHAWENHLRSVLDILAERLRRFRSGRGACEGASIDGELFAAVLEGVHGLRDTWPAVKSIFDCVSTVTGLRLTPSQGQRSLYSLHRRFSETARAQSLLRSIFDAIEAGGGFDLWSVEQLTLAAAGLRRMDLSDPQVLLVWEAICRALWKKKETATPEHIASLAVGMRKMHGNHGVSQDLKVYIRARLRDFSTTQGVLTMRQVAKIISGLTHMKCDPWVIDILQLLKPHMKQRIVSSQDLMLIMAGLGNKDWNHDVVAEFWSAVGDAMAPPKHFGSFKRPLSAHELTTCLRSIFSGMFQNRFSNAFKTAMKVYSGIIALANHSLATRRYPGQDDGLAHVVFAECVAAIQSCSQASGQNPDDEDKYSLAARLQEDLGIGTHNANSLLDLLGNALMQTRFLRVGDSLVVLDLHSMSHSLAEQALHFAIGYAQTRRSGVQLQVIYGRASHQARANNVMRDLTVAALRVPFEDANGSLSAWIPNSPHTAGAAGLATP